MRQILKWPAMLRGALIIVALLSLFTVSYVTTSVVTSCPAEACTCSDSECIMPGTFSAAILAIEGLVLGSLTAMQLWLIQYYATAMDAFRDKVSETIDTITDRWIKWWDTFWWYNLRPAMQAMTEQLNTADANETRDLGAFNDAQHQNMTRKERLMQDVESHREMRPGENVCVGGTVAGGMVRARTFERAYNAQAPVEALPRSGLKKGTASEDGTFADQAARWSRYVSDYCDKDDNNGYPGCSSNGTHPNEDMDVAGQVFAKDTIDLTDNAKRKVVDDLISNIAEPFVAMPVSQSVLKTGQGQQRALEFESYKARRQAIYDALYFVVARRAPGSNMKDFIEPLRQSAGYSGSSDNPSRNEIMNVMMSERFRTGKYNLDQIGEPENNAREMVIQSAFEVMQLSDELDLLDRYSLVLAAQASDQVRAYKPFDPRVEASGLR